MVLVTGAQITLFSTAIAPDRVITKKGRRPTLSISPHHTSPQLGPFTRIPRSPGFPVHQDSSAIASPSDAIAAFCSDAVGGIR